MFRGMYLIPCSRVNLDFHATYKPRKTRKEKEHQSHNFVTMGKDESTNDTMLAEAVTQDLNNLPDICI